MSPRIPLIYGGATFGAPGTRARITTVPECQAMVDLFASLGQSEYDTSNFYGDGTSEETFSKLDLKGGQIDTKIFPRTPGDHSPEKLRASVIASAKKLAPHKIRILYLHIPDRSVPFEDTLRELDALHKEGYFQEIGLSNYNSWEVAEMYTIAKERGWVTPSVYQGLYNVLERNPEVELIPALRKYGIKYYVYSPLAGGVIAGKFLSVEDFSNSSIVGGTRWDTSGASPIAAFLQSRYKKIVDNVKKLKEALESHNIALAEAALRWLQHHSALKPEAGDRIIIGATKLKQLEENVEYSGRGPLPDEIITLLNATADSIKGQVAHYAV